MAIAFLARKVQWLDVLLRLFFPFHSRSLLPGWTTLTWSTMNIDAFLHRVQTAIASLKALSDRVGGLLKEKVYRTLEEMGRFSLYDGHLAASKAWVGTKT